MQHVEKPWGSELWVAVTDRYAFKIINVKKGTRTSLQYHERKHEHIYIDAGRVKATYEDGQGRLVQRELGPGEVLESKPFQKHRFEALEDARMLEVSTPELDDVVRVEDDFRR